jgi:hypothetical protein
MLEGGLGAKGCDARRQWVIKMIYQIKNFSTELLHPKLRSSVQRISVPSQTAEVSW